MMVLSGLHLRRIVVLSIPILILVIGFWHTGVSASVSDNDFDRSRLIVKFAPINGTIGSMKLGATGRTAFDDLLTDRGVTQLRQAIPTLPASHRGSVNSERARLMDYVIIAVPADTDADQLKKEIEQLSEVEFAEFDVIVRITAPAVTPDDPYFATHQYPLRNTGSQPPADNGTSGADAQMQDAWVFTTGDTNVVLAIIDTGIDFQHPDLLGRLWYNVDESSDGEDADSNGYVSDYAGWNFFGNNNNPDDDHSHGSHCAGIAGADSDNGVGVTGMDWNCQLMALKALGSSGSGSAADVAEAITYAADNGADVISMSLGSNTPSSLEEDAIDYAVSLNVSVFAAMGNDNSSLPHYPAAFPNAIAVGATDSDDRRALPFCGSPGSNYGDYIDICAAGNWVWSTVLDGNYGYKCGTSMATPHAAGLATLIKALRPNYTPAQVRALMYAGAEDQVGRVNEDTPGFDHYHGWGRINGRITLQALALDFDPILSLPGAQIVTEQDTLEFVVTAEDSNFTPIFLSAEMLANAAFVDSGNGVGVYTITPDLTQQGSYDVLFVASDGVDADSGLVTITILDGCDCPSQNDLNSDGFLDAVDLNDLIDILFFGGTDILDPGCPANRSDFDCDGFSDAIDLNLLIDHLFFGGAGPCNPCLP